MGIVQIDSLLVPVCAGAIYRQLFSQYLEVAILSVLCLKH